MSDLQSKIESLYEQAREYQEMGRNFPTTGIGGIEQQLLDVLDLMNEDASSDLMPYCYRISRQNLEHETTVFVRFKAQPSFDFLDSLRRAVAKYIVNTEDGKDLYLASGGDTTLET